MAISERQKPSPIGKGQLLREGEELEAFARSLGAEIYGVAAAEAFKEFSKKPQPSKFVPDAKSVVVIGMPFTPELFATVAKPALAEVSRKGAEDAALGEKHLGIPPVGAERYFINEEQAMLTDEIIKIGYKIS